jgi:hypothetical protein
MSENRGVLYKTRWEILLMAATLIITAIVVVAIPNDFTDKMLKQQKMEKEAMEKAEQMEKGIEGTEMEHEEHEEETGTTEPGKNMTLGTKP